MTDMHSRDPSTRRMTCRRWLVAVLLVLYGTLQIFVPSKAFLVEGCQSWSYQQQVGSWRMKLNHKSAFVDFVVMWPDGRNEIVDQGRLLNDRQRGEIWRTPRLLCAFARYVAEALADGPAFKDVGNGGPSAVPNSSGPNVRPAVFCIAMASLNGRPLQWFVQPGTDLSRAVLPGFSAPGWLVPLDTEAAPGQYLGSEAEREAAVRRLLAERGERATDVE